MRLSLPLSRALVAIDIEATGINPRVDRIVEIAATRVTPDCNRTSLAYRVHPGVPIPREASAIHGITDGDVAACPPFKSVAPPLLDFIGDADLLGYNLIRFDLPMLSEECLRCGTTFSLEGRRVIDCQRIFHQREPRDLSAALAFYCGRTHSDAHGAQADADATLHVLEGQLERYRDLPRDLDALHAYCDPRHPAWADTTGKLKWVDGELRLNFGQRKGTPLRKLVAENDKYLNWMLRSDFPRDTKKIVENAIAGQWPPPPDA